MRYCKDIAACYFEYFENAWSCPSTMIVPLCRKLWCPKCWNQLVRNFDFICMQKINYILHIFLEILQRYYKPVILGTFRMHGSAHKKWYCQIVENFCVYLQAKKIDFINHDFLEIIQRYANLFWVLWTCLATKNQHYSINLQKTSMFICILKIRRPETTSVCFSVINVNDEHGKPEFKIKHRR